MIELIRVDIQYPGIVAIWDNLLSWLQEKEISLPYLVIAQNAYNRHFAIRLSYSGRRAWENIVRPLKPQVWKTIPIWHTYYELSVGKHISDSSELRKMEKKGYAFCKPEEIDAAADRAVAEREAKKRADFKERMVKNVADIKKGRKFTLEHRATLEKLRNR
jgi:hypothetical protein